VKDVPVEDVDVEDIEYMPPTAKGTFPGVFFSGLIQIFRLSRRILILLIGNRLVL